MLQQLLMLCICLHSGEAGAVIDCQQGDECTPLLLYLCYPIAT